MVVAVCKDFQRAKAASLVSSKRKLNVGDSTWLAQRTALALAWWRKHEKNFQLTNQLMHHYFKAGSA